MPIVKPSILLARCLFARFATSIGDPSLPFPPLGVEVLFVAELVAVTDEVAVLSAKTPAVADAATAERSALLTSLPCKGCPRVVHAATNELKGPVKDSWSVALLQFKETVWMKEAKEAMFEEAEEQTPGARSRQSC